MSLKLAVFVSGGGTNLEAIMEAIESGYIDGEIVQVISNKKDAYALERAKNHHVPGKYVDFSKKDAFDELSKELKDIDLIVLAGFLVIIPESFVNEFSGRIINLHPSLLPKHGGDGMYGLNVHRDVIESSDKLSGASVHYVDAGTDTGPIIAQAMVNVYNDDDEEKLQKRISYVEHSLLVKVIRRWQR